MFPTGTAGAALLMLRFSVVATLLVDGTAHWALVTSVWLFVGFTIPAVFLVIGLLTPYCSTLSCLLQLATLLVATRENRFPLAISILNSAILAGLGPGAFSIDARIFGRRLLTLPPQQ